MASTEAVVATINDLQDGEMKQVSVGETKVLLVRVAGEFHAVGAYCSHYGALLARGALRGDRVVCPWHNACFSATTGNLQEPPGLDSLARYDVRVEGEDVIVSLPQEQPSGLRTPPMAQYARDTDGRTFAILGAGVAGIHAAETLRQAGYQGRIVLVDREVKLPYDRTQLSKGYLAGKAVKFRGIPFFWTTQFNIRLRYVGHAQQWDEIIFDGNPQEGEFLAFYVKDKRVLAVAGTRRDRDTAAISELMRLEEMPSPDALRRGKIDWVGQLKK